ncbi:hypothetical protein FEA48_30835 [Pseudomonas nitroreducens]|uniref:Type II toxin-antitoxin system YafO family toxin n=1 Tax=Pseudomonas nitroreducens TaxID=46680 RepID=A0A5R8ZS98_PSENT|nr:type II toxin-antitoxin system YafO family toxin [Pseudomonas nitroreducens]TLP68251.1 hypothetical protein FEA48_30835 [Pseudomonas nitroreducens]
MVRIDVHPVFVDQFSSEDQDEVDLRESLIASFTRWIERGTHPDFGKDVTYRDPEGSVVPESGLRHVHITPALGADEEQCRKWEKYRTSNTHLVYVRADTGPHLLLYYFEHDAHRQARADQYRWLKALGRAADQWLKENKLYPCLREEVA